MANHNREHLSLDGFGTFFFGDVSKIEKHSDIKPPLAVIRLRSL